MNAEHILLSWVGGDVWSVYSVTTFVFSLCLLKKKMLRRCDSLFKLVRSETMDLPPSHNIWFRFDLLSILRVVLRVERNSVLMLMLH